MHKEQLILDQQATIAQLHVDKINLQQQNDRLEWELEQTKIDYEHQSTWAIAGFMSTIVFGTMLLLEKFPTIGDLLYKLMCQIADTFM